MTYHGAQENHLARQGWVGAVRRKEAAAATVDQRRVRARERAGIQAKAAQHELDRRGQQICQLLLRCLLCRLLRGHLLLLLRELLLRMPFLDGHFCIIG